MADPVLLEDVPSPAEFIDASLSTSASASNTAPSFAELAEMLSQINVVDSIGRPVSGLSKVEMLQELEEVSLDFYSMLRSVSDQKRLAELKEALGQSLLSATATETTSQQPDWAQTDQAAGPVDQLRKPAGTVVIGGPKIIKVN